jgi:peptide/nickel transport system permease protein/oligopeptide transport system permease protein
MGADLNGRDVYSRIVYGARISLSIAILSQLFALAVGLPMGAAAGWLGGKTDFVIMRIVDVMSALPVLLLAFLIMLRMGASYWNVLLAISLTTWIEICRLTRAQFLTLREKEFVEASRRRRHARIVWAIYAQRAGADHRLGDAGRPARHLCRGRAEFLGVGINPPTPSWGQMIAEDRQHPTYFWHSPLPGVMIAFTMLGFTSWDGLRDTRPKMVEGK